MRRPSLALAIMFVPAALAGCPHAPREVRQEAAEHAASRGAEPSPSSLQPPAPPPRTVLWIGGDLLLSGAIRRAMRSSGDPAQSFARLLDPVARQWREDGEAALVMVNLESPVAATRRHDSDRYSKNKRGPARVPAPLNAPAWLLTGLARAGVDAVMLANNHMLDQEREGLAETMEAVERAGLVATGAGRTPHVTWPIVVGEEGARTALFAFYDKHLPEPALDPGTPSISVLDQASMVAVRTAAEQHDHVVVVVHVVGELISVPKRAWRQWGGQLIEAGAAVVAVHGTHVPGPVERVRVGDREGIIAWSLGNFLSDMGSGATPSRRFPNRSSKWEAAETRESLVMRIELAASDVSVSFLPVWMSHNRWVVRNGVLDEPLAFELLPMAACGPAITLPSHWPAHWRAEMVEWVGARREHLLRASGLSPPSPCEPGAVRLLSL